MCSFIIFYYVLDIYVLLYYLVIPVWCTHVRDVESRSGSYWFSNRPSFLYFLSDYAFPVPVYWVSCYFQGKYTYIFFIFYFLYIVIWIYISVFVHLGSRCPIGSNQCLPWICTGLVDIDWIKEWLCHQQGWLLFFSMFCPMLFLSVCFYVCICTCIMYHVSCIILLLL